MQQEKKETEMQASATTEEKQKCNRKEDISNNRGKKTATGKKAWEKH